MRCTQIIGLKDEAIIWLRENGAYETEVERCIHCGEVTKTTKVKIWKTYDDTGSSGMFEDGPHLREHSMQNGDIVREVVQCAPWASGPCIFLCLEKEDGSRLFEWSDEEIEANC